MTMPPSEDRRYRRCLLAAVPCALIVGTLADVGDWSASVILLSALLIVVAMAYYVHRERPGERGEQERFARERGLPYPPERRPLRR
jgi:hypothetical protein